MTIDERLAALFDYIEESRNRPHHPVEHNCALFTAGALRLMTDRDFVTELDIKLETERDALRVLAEYGGVRGLAVACLGSDPLPPLLARRGDVVIKDGDGGETLGVCLGEHAVFLTVDGLQRRDLMECTGCWRVEYPA